MDTVTRGRLTAREEQVLGLLGAGHTNKVMARILNISPRTIEAHRMQVMRKFGALNTVDLVIRTQDWVPKKISETDISLTTPLDRTLDLQF